MTDPLDEYGELLRRVLRAEAEKIEPSPDGLERIRARVEATRRRRAPWFRPAFAIGLAAIAAGAVILTTPALREHTQQPIAGSRPTQSGPPASTVQPEVSPAPVVTPTTPPVSRFPLPSPSMVTSPTTSGPGRLTPTCPSTPPSRPDGYPTAPAAAGRDCPSSPPKPPPSSSRATTSSSPESSRPTGGVGGTVVSPSPSP